MKIFPKSFSLNIFGKKVKVKVVKIEHMGLFLASTWQILINPEQTKEDAIKTLIHETCHSMIQRTGINQALNNELEEVICENVSTVICENFNLTLKNQR